MITALLVLFYGIINNLQIQSGTEEVVWLKKVDSLERIVAILTIAFISIISLFALTLFQKHKLKKELDNLKK